MDVGGLRFIQAGIIFLCSDIDLNLFWQLQSIDNCEHGTEYTVKSNLSSQGL